MQKSLTSPRWASRFPQNHYLHTTTFDKSIGLLFGNGQRWKEARRVTLKLLHQLDFFRPAKLESFVVPEIVEIVKTLGEKVDCANEAGSTHYFSPHQMFQVAALNVVCQLVMGRRFHHTDKEAVWILEQLSRSNLEFTASLEVFPWLKHFPFLTFLGSHQRGSNILYGFFRVGFFT